VQAESCAAKRAVATVLKQAEIERQRIETLAAPKQRLIAD
jgi:hypothetical protein